jgi:hypothetical protein
VHDVVDGEHAADEATRRVDVERDVLLGLRVERHQLRHERVGDRVLDRTLEVEDAVVVQLAEHAGSGEEVQVRAAVMGRWRRK